MGKCVFKPLPAGSAEKAVPVLRENLEDAPRIAGLRINPDAKILQRDALAVEHAKHIMIGNDEQFRGIAKGAVFSEPGRITMTMGRDNRQIANMLIDRIGSWRQVDGAGRIVVEGAGHECSIVVAFWSKYSLCIAARSDKVSRTELRCNLVMLTAIALSSAVIASSML